MLGMSLDDLIANGKKQSSGHSRGKSSSKFAKAFNIRKDVSKGRRSMSDDDGAPRVVLRSNRREGCTVRVTNIPYDLTWKDVKNAFESAGDVVRCDVEDGIANIVFSHHREAQHAVKTYDGGDMNGRIIRASLV